MTDDMRPALYDVWRMEFEFDDQPGVAKHRPVVVGAMSDNHAEVLVVKVTSHGPRHSFPGEVPLRGWREAGLDRPSVARCSRTLIVPLEAFEGQRRYGRLTQADAEAVAAALHDLDMTL